MWQSLVWPRSSASRYRAQLRMEGAHTLLISLGDALTWWSLMRQHHQHLSKCTLPRYVRGQPVRQGIQEAAALRSHCCLLSGNRLSRLSQQPRLALVLALRASYVCWKRVLPAALPCQRHVTRLPPAGQPAQVGHADSETILGARELQTQAAPARAGLPGCSAPCQGELRLTARCRYRCAVPPHHLLIS